MSPPTCSPFELGPWRVEPLMHRLVRLEQRGAAPVHITPKTMEVLLYLAGHAGQVVTREALLDSVWPETHIREEIITRAISDLRSALGDDRRAPRFIETIPKVGYRLIAPVRRLEGIPPDTGAPDSGFPETSEPNGRGQPILSPSAEVVAEAPTSRTWIPLLAGAALAAALVGFGMVLNRDRPGPDAGGAPVAAAAPLEASPLTSDPGFESFAEISPDGRRVAYSQSGAARDGEPENVDVYVRTVDGGEPRRLTSDPAIDLGATWSPDGLRLAFGRYQSPKDGQERCSLMEVPVAGGPERRLGSCGKNGTADFAWSPSGEWIAFSDRREGDKTFGIYLLSTLSGESHLLVAPDEPHWGDRDPRFSPDGGQVAFTRSVSMNTQDVFRIPVTGGEPLRVTRDGRPIRGHDWTGDGSSLVVSSRRTGSRGLWRFPLDGGAPSWLPIAVDHAWNPTLSRTAGPLLFEYRVLEVGLRERALGSSDGPPAAWLASTREDLDPQHSPDGRRIAFASNRSGYFEIWSATADGSDLLQLTAMNGAYTGSPRWSPDGRSIVFDARLDGQADVYRVVPGELPERLTEHPANDLGPSFSPDGLSVYFGSNRTGDWQIWRRPAAGGEPEQVTADGGYQALVSASEGTVLLLTRFGQDGLFRLALDPGAAHPAPGGEPVLGTEDLVGSEHWTLAGDTIYWISALDGQLSLERLRSHGTVERVADLGSPDLMPGLSLSADESSMLYAELTRLEADLWLVDAGVFLAR